MNQLSRNQESGLLIVEDKNVKRQLKKHSGDESGCKGSDRSGNTDDIGSVDEAIFDD